LDLFGSCDLDLDPMTFIHELDLYSLEVPVYRMCQYELPTSTLSKVRLTNRQTDRTDIIYDAASWVVRNLMYFCSNNSSITSARLRTVSSSSRDQSKPPACAAAAAG